MTICEAQRAQTDIGNHCNATMPESCQPAFSGVVGSTNVPIYPFTTSAEPCLSQEVIESSLGENSKSLTHEGVMPSKMTPENFHAHLCAEKAQLLGRGVKTMYGEETDSFVSNECEFFPVSSFAGKPAPHSLFIRESEEFLEKCSLYYLLLHDSRGIQRHSHHQRLQERRQQLSRKLLKRKFSCIDADPVPQSGEEDSSSFEPYEPRIEESDFSAWEHLRHFRNERTTTVRERHNRRAKKNGRKRRQKVREAQSKRFGPQSGAETTASVISTIQEDISGMQEFVKLAHLEIPDKWFKTLEACALCAFGLASTDNISTASTHVLQFLNAISSRSVSGVFLTFFQQVMKDDPVTQQGGLEPQWLGCLRDLRSNWSRATQHPVFRRLGILLSAAISFGFCEATSIEWSVEGVSLFNHAMLPKFRSCIDLFDALLGVISFFIEGGFMCFQRGSLAPLFCADLRTIDLEDEFVLLESMVGCFRVGNLQERYKVTEQDVIRRLCALRDKIKEVELVCDVPYAKTILARRKRDVVHLLDTANDLCVKGGLRIVPFSQLFFGPPGVGKSTLCNAALMAVLKSNGFACGDTDVAVINDSDKFMSNVRSDTVAYVLDDVGNCKPDFVERSPCQKIIEISNNVKSYANMAEVELKGKVPIQPKVFFATSNSKSAGAAIYSQAPLSIVRRFNGIVTVGVKPQFAINGDNSVTAMLDNVKVNQYYGTDEFPIFPDIWYITVERAVPIQSDDPEGKGVCYEIIKWNGIPLDKVSIFDYLEYLTGASKEHYAHQEKVVSSSKNLGERIKLCQSCNKLTELCKCDGHFMDTVPELPNEELPEDTTIVFEDESVGSSIPALDDDNANFLVEQLDVQIDELRDKLVEAERKYSEFEPEGRHVVWDYLRTSYREEIEKLTSRKLAIIYADPPATNQAGLENFVPNFNLLGLFDQSVGAKAFGSWFLTRWLLDPWITWFSLDDLKKHATSTVQDLSYNGLREVYGWLQTSPYSRWTTYVPSSWWKHPIVQNVATKTNQQMILKEMASTTRALTIQSWIVFLSVVLGFLYTRSFLFPCAFALWSLYVLVQMGVRADIAKRNVLHQLENHRDAFSEATRTTMESYTKKFLIGAGSLAALYSAIHLIRRLRRSKVAVQSQLDPETAEEVAARDAQVNPWSKAIIAPLPVSGKARCQTHDEMVAKVQKNLGFLRLESDAGVYVSNVFFVKSNVGLIPTHLWDRLTGEDFHGTVRFKPGSPTGVTGAEFKTILSKRASVPIPETDLTLVSLPSITAKADLTHLFFDALPSTIQRTVEGTLVYRNRDGYVQLSPVNLRGGVVSTYRDGVPTTFEGCSYDVQWPTHVGMCMSPVIARSIVSGIAGLHLGGKEGAAYGCAGSFTKATLEQCLVELDAKPGVNFALSEGDFPQMQMGKEFFLAPELHYKSPVLYLVGNPVVEPLGTVLGHVHPTSEVVESPLSPLIEEIMGVPRKHGPPQMRPSWRPFQMALQPSSEPPPGFEVSLLQQAMSVYAVDLAHIGKKSFIQKELCPLDECAMINGIPGKRFIDPLPRSTSVGYPLNKPKRDFMHPREDNPEQMDFDPVIWEEYARVVECFKKGERAYCIFNSCAKDEPVALDKDKVRVFQAGPVALQLLVRKYFLPIGRAFSLYPIRSKIAVGINAISPEWDELFTDLRRFGDNTLFGGDYKNYDQRMPAQLILAAFDVMIRFAREYGQYSQDDLHMMKCIAMEIAYPLVNCNGTLIQFAGMHCSGQSMTVYVNSIANVLMIYSFVLRRYPEITNMYPVLSLTTYGDDNVVGVNPMYPDITHVKLAEFLAVRDVIYTMPDKKSAPIPYIPLDDLDFLKRKNWYNPDLGCQIALLDEGSCFKQLHCLMKSEFLSLRELALLNCGSALREWFYYGREKFELRQHQLIEVIERAGMLPSPEVLASYDSRVQDWITKYRPTPD